MDAIWYSAPAMALHVSVGPDGAVAGARANPAAERWAAAQGLQAPPWWALARQALAVLRGSGREDGPTMIAAGLGERALRLTCVPHGNGWLLWVEPVAPAFEMAPPPDAPTSSLGPLTDGDVMREDGALARALLLAGVAVWRRDLTTDRMRFNPVGNLALGLPADTPEVSAADVRAAIHPDDLPAVERAAAEALASHRVVDAIARYRNPDGSWRTRLTRRIAERDVEGRPVALAGISINLDQQLREHERAELLAQRTRLVADAIGVGFWTVDITRGSVEWDDQMFRIHRRDPALGPPTLADWITEIVHPEDRAWVGERRRRADERWETITEMVFRGLDDPSGQERWIHSWACRVERDGRRWLFGMHVDVSDRQRAQQRLMRERERAQFALDAAGIGVWERDADGHIVYWNEAMYRLRGFDPRDPREPDELMALSTEDEDLSRGAEMFRRHLADGAPYRLEMRLRHPDGQPRWVMTHGRAMLDVAGRALGAVGVHIDITERKRVEAMELEKQRIEQSSRDKSAFMARVSHELRTPLNAVLGFARLLEDDLDEPPTRRQRDRLHRIAGAGSQLLALVDEVLELADAEAEPVPPQARTAVPLAPVVDAARLRIVGAAAAQGVSVDVEAVEPTLAALGEPRRLQRALQLLLEHALRRSPAGGHIQLRAERAGDAAPGPARARIVVRDLGRGLTPRQYLWLFEPFVGDDVASDARAPGGGAPADDDSGVRLALARALVQAVGGEVRAGSRADADADANAAGGIELEIHLPLAEAPAAPTAAPVRDGAAAPRGAGGPGLSVLCVEDNPVNLQLVCELIAMLPGVRLRTAIDGLSGLAAARDETPDVLLLDLQLPDLNGIEVMRRLRADPAFASSTFVALSADAMPDNVEAALKAGFDAYWTKPIDFGHFLGELRRLATHHRARATAEDPAD